MNRSENETMKNVYALLPQRKKTEIYWPGRENW